jgi:SAM-dependent methyltransferase
MKEENFINDQEKLYDKKAASYSKHHGDPYSEAYRELFLRSRYRKVLSNIDLKGKLVLDAMCAFGAQTGLFIEMGAEVIGLDISPNNAKIFEKRWGKKCLIASIHDTKLADSSVDLVYVGGGLHHVLPILEDSIKEIHRILKPGGIFCFDEPNKDTWVDNIRKFWYKRDKSFGDTEQAISYTTELIPFIKKLGFKELMFDKIGNLAYILIAQSNILGIPLVVKRIIYRPLFFIEKMISKLPFTPKLYFVAIWQKNKK